MSMLENPPLVDTDFLANESYSFRAVDNAWVRKRAAQLVNPIDLGQPNILGALVEAAEVLYDRVGVNAKEDAHALFFYADNDTDPFVIAIPLDHRSIVEKRAEKGPITPPPKPTPPAKETTLREDFEDLLFQEGSFDHKVLDRLQNGRYKTPWVQAKWEGFCMYHNKLVTLPAEKYKPRYDKVLGRYIIGKVGDTGAILFHNVPFRHQTKALALEEANRLSAEFQHPFAIFRCLDIINLAE